MAVEMKKGNPLLFLFGKFFYKLLYALVVKMQVGCHKRNFPGKPKP